MHHKRLAQKEFLDTENGPNKSEYKPKRELLLVVMRVERFWTWFNDGGVGKTKRRGAWSGAAVPEIIKEVRGDMERASRKII
jgi:hypothetical protein